MRCKTKQNVAIQSYLKLLFYSLKSQEGSNFIEYELLLFPNISLSISHSNMKYGIGFSNRIIFKTQTCL